jgi:hypothetical protein
MPADDGAAAVADTKNLPTGYGQRFLLNQSAEYYQRQQTPTYGFGVSPEGVGLQIDSARAGTPAPEQVLFVFRVVDTPLAKPAVEATKANAAATSPVRGAGAETTGQGDRANAPLAAPGNSAK